MRSAPGWGILAASLLSIFSTAQAALLPAKAVIDVPLALTIVGLGILILVAPWSVPGLTPPLCGAGHANLL